MEIFSYVLRDALGHNNSLGNDPLAFVGGVQYMSSGSEIKHLEFNPPHTDDMRFVSSVAIRSQSYTVNL